MEEELNITGLQYNWMGVLFMIGYLSQVVENVHHAMNQFLLDDIYL